MSFSLSQWGLFERSLNKWVSAPLRKAVSEEALWCVSRSGFVVSYDYLLPGRTCSPTAWNRWLRKGRHFDFLRKDTNGDASWSGCQRGELDQCEILLIKDPDAVLSLIHFS